MKITIISSGSKGNSTLIETKKNNILIDAGLPLKTLEKRLNKKMPPIDTLIITHSHSDHIKGLKSLLKEHKPTIYTHQETSNDITFYDNIKNDKNIKINDVEITLFELSHDVTCQGVLLKENKKEVLYITDTGYIKNKLLESYKNKDVYIIESNYEEDMLLNGSYPFYLKQRIRSDKGHLSNDTTCRYLKKLIGNDTKYLFLAHLSEENNKPEIVEEKVNKTIAKIDNNIKEIIICSQTEIKEIEI